MEDEIVKDIHEIRRRVFEECGGDIERYIERLKAGNDKHKDRLVTLEQVQESSRAPKTKAQ